MATLQNIRNRSGLLLLVIGIAMLAFILGDFMQSQRSGSGGSLYVGEVAGQDLNIQAFEERIQKGTENYRNSNPNTIINQTVLSQIRNSIWDEYIKELIMDAEFEKLGIDVNSEELFELFQGNNLHPEISKIELFQDPNSKQFDRTRMIQYMKSLESDQNQEAIDQWLGFEDYISDLRKNEKYNTLLSKGIYVNSYEAQLYFNDGNENTSFEYVSIPTGTIPDSIINIKDSELRNYYDNNSEKYQQDESYDVDYVVFTTVPSKEDDEDTKKDLAAIIQNFASYEDFEIFVKRNSDVSNVQFSFLKEEQISDTNLTSLFDAEKGTVLGPYLFSNENYRLAKLVDVQNRPDSVQARHILIVPDETKDLDSSNLLVESFIQKINLGTDFADIAQEYSTDKTSAIKGGDLGWFNEGVMVDAFNEICFTSSKNDLNIVQTDFGIHLVQVTNRSREVKKVKIAYIDRIVTPSSETYHNYYTQAAQFAGALLNTDTTSFDELINSSNLAKRDQDNVLPNTQNISGLDNSRAMIKWMVSSNVGDISEVFEFGDNYVVANLVKKHMEGDIPFEDVKEEVRVEVLRQKKLNMLIENINNTSYNSLEELSTKMQSTVKQASKANFLSSQIQDLGIEPDLVGLLSVSPNDELSRPLAGVNSVYVVKVLSRNEPRTTGDFTPQKSQIINSLKQNVSTSVYNALKNDADIVDNRNEFY